MKEYCELLCIQNVRLPTYKPLPSYRRNTSDHKHPPPHPLPLGKLIFSFY